MSIQALAAAHQSLSQAREFRSPSRLINRARRKRSLAGLPPGLERFSPLTEDNDPWQGDLASLLLLLRCPAGKQVPAFQTRSQRLLHPFRRNDGQTLIQRWADCEKWWSNHNQAGPSRQQKGHSRRTFGSSTTSSSHAVHGGQSSLAVKKECSIPLRQTHHPSLAPIS